MWDLSNNINWNAYLIAGIVALLYLILVTPPVENYLYLQLRTPIMYYAITALLLATIVFLLVNWLES